MESREKDDLLFPFFMYTKNLDKNMEGDYKLVNESQENRQLSITNISSHSHVLLDNNSFFNSFLKTMNPEIVSQENKTVN